MKRAAKLRRLDDLRRSVPYVSARALEAILQEAQRDMPKLTNRKAMVEARDLQVNQATPYGPCMITLPVELESGVMDEVVIVNPFAQLWTAAKIAKAFHA